jgi:hypothetical protein
MKCKSVTLDVDGTVRVEEYDGCDDIYRIIGRNCSMFESIRGAPFDVFIDEEGKMNGQPLNIVATDLLRESGIIFPKDFIAGKAMFCGKPDKDGNATDVWANIERLVCEYVGSYRQFML